MTRTIWIVAALLATFGSAEAQVPRVVRILEQSYELDLSDVSFPVQAPGPISVSPCATCVRESHSTTETTIYLFNSKPLPYPEFLKAVDARRKTSKPTFVGVYYDVESKRVTRVLMKGR
jgi:hypothetical protein